MYRRFQFCHTRSSCPWAERQNLRYEFSVKLTSRQVGIAPFIPVTGFISKSRNHPFEQIGFPQHHHGKVLFLVPSCLFSALLCCAHILPWERKTVTEKKLRTRISVFFMEIPHLLSLLFLIKQHKTAAGISSGSCWFRGGGIRQALPWLRQSFGRIPGRSPCRLRSGSAGERGHRRCQGRRTAGGFP